jgi:hypothetical protein
MADDSSNELIHVHRVRSSCAGKLHLPLADLHRTTAKVKIASFVRLRVGTFHRCLLERLVILRGLWGERGANRPGASDLGRRRRCSPGNASDRDAQPAAESP